MGNTHPTNRLISRIRMGEILLPPSFEIFPQLLEIGGGGTDLDSNIDGTEKGGQW
jgi:hypothetical protein